MDLRRLNIILGLLGWPLLPGCVVLPIDGGSTATTVQTFEAGGDLEGRGVGFAGYFSRPSQPGLFVQLQSVRDGAVGGQEHYKWKCAVKTSLHFGCSLSMPTDVSQYVSQ